MSKFDELRQLREAAFKRTARKPIVAQQPSVKLEPKAPPVQNTGEPVLSAAAVLGKRGGLARSRKLTPEQRQAIAQLGAQARWPRK